MKKFTTRLVLTGLFFVLCLSYSYAQNGPIFQSVKGQLIRTTPRLADIDPNTMYGQPLQITRRGDEFAGGITDPEKAEEAIFKKWFPSKTDRSRKEIMLDAANKYAAMSANKANGFTAQTPTATIGVNMDGQTFPGFAPSDNNMAVGPNHIIQIINHSSGSGFRVWDKAGTPLTGSIVLSSITGVTGAGDPVVVYDQLADRWVLTEFGVSCGIGSYINTLIVAVSTTPDPTGTWKVYSYCSNVFAGGYFVDYPKYAVWNNAYYATSNDFNTSGTAYLGSSIYAFDRTAMIAGAATATMIRVQFTGSGSRYYSMAPVCQEGATVSNQSGLFSLLQDNAWVGAPTDSILLFEFTPDFTTPANSVIGPFQSMATLPYNTNVPAINQLGSAQTFQSLSQRLMHKVIYRNFGAYESIVCNTTDNVASTASVHWWELRRPGAGNWSIYQEGIWTNPGFHRFMGSISINASGTIGLLYNTSGSTIFPSLKFTGRNSCDPLGTMTLPEQTVINGTTFNANNRYGDYNSLSVDPSNNSTFWGTGQYNANGFGTFGNWGTRIVSFSLSDPCAGAVIVPAGSTLVTEGCAAPNGVIDPVETVTVSFCIQNSGLFNTTNLVATLQPSGGVVSPSGPQNYGVVLAGGPSVCRNFTFTNSGTCGGTITASLQLQDGATNLGTITYTFTLGNLVNATLFSENFDGVSVPALPAGWVATQGVNITGAPMWQSSNSGTPTPVAASAPNSIFSSDPSNILDNLVETPTIAIPGGSGTRRVTFQNNYNVESTFDGGVLEISINGGAYADIITAGGSFVSGGYTSTISSSFGSPIAGRQAWSGNSGGFITTTVNLPAAALGQNIKLRFRMASDNSVSVQGWRVDDVTVVSSQYVCCSNCSENFDAVTPPALPTGWTASTPTSCANTTPWVSDNTTSSSAPNSVSTNDPNCISDEVLDSRLFPITSSSAVLTFQVNYNLENTFDGLVLEISSPNINGGAFTDILAAGGSFSTGAYNGTISLNFGSPILGRQAWTGNSGGFILVTVNLPASVNGQSIQLRWRRATDSSVGAVGAWVDDVVIIGSDCTPSCTITCPANITVNNTAGQCGANVTYPAPTTSGLCGTVITSPASGAFFPVGTTTVTATAQTGATCTFTITVVDAQPPTTTCPANQTRSTNLGVCTYTAVGTEFNATATDNCPGVTKAYTLTGVTTGSGTTLAGVVFNKGVTTVTWTSTDAASNTSNCSFTVTVNDTENPHITCKANATKTTAVNVCTYTTSGTEFDPATISDNCPGVTQSYALTGATTGTGTSLAGKAFNTGVTTVTWTATDASGNTAVCSFTVTVNDGSLPIVTQPSNKTVCEGDNATFTVVGTTGATLTYKWQQWNGTAWVDIAGATSSSYTVSNTTVAMNTNSFRVILTTICGNSITSSFATLYVNKLPVISLTTSRSPALIPGQFVIITANVNPTGGTIVWRKNGVVITGYNAFSIPNLTVDDIGTYDATYTDLNGCVKSSASVSLTAQAYDKLFVYPNPTTGLFQVRFYNAPGQPVSVVIFDAKGAKVYQRSLTTGQLAYSRIDVDLSKHSSGVYVVDLMDASGNKIATKRFILGH